MIASLRSARGREKTDNDEVDPADGGTAVGWSHTTGRIMGRTNNGTPPRIIDALMHPHDLKALNDDELAIVCREIRAQIVATASRTGGHVASSLGAVETIVALHAELDCPNDRLVFDVGHQAYAHKILTGRLDRFDTLRQYGGISGFPSPLESDFDVHPSGHASDSLSVALGLAKARDLHGTNEHVVTLIGDASISGGMAFEALNQIGLERTRMVIVLNDNGMSISPNVGALAHHFGNLRASNAYRDRRDFLQRQLSKSGPLTRGLLELMNSAKGSVKHLLLPEYTMMFEQLGITCLAPVDGHDLTALRHALRSALDSHGPTLVHVVTHKGAGYDPAERIPQLFHGVGPFDPTTGEPRCAEEEGPTFTDVFGTTLLQEATLDDRIFAITAGMEGGTGLSSFAQVFPERFVDVGIAEEHAVGLASGLAAGGEKPVVAVYSTFLQRGIDQVIVDVALCSKDVVLCVDRAGLAGEDGPTHQGVFDLAYLRMIPNLRILAPADGAELESALHTALALGGPFAIRYPKGGCLPIVEHDAPEDLTPGVARTLVEGTEVALLSWGSMTKPALDAASRLAEAGVSARVVDMRWAKPLDREAIRAAAKTELLVTIEEGVCAGGMGEAVLGVLATEDLQARVLQLGVPDRFVAQGTREELLGELGLDGAGIARSVLEKLGRANEGELPGPSAPALR